MKSDAPHKATESGPKSAASAGGAIGWCVARFPGNAQPKWYSTKPGRQGADLPARFVVMPWANGRSAEKGFTFWEIAPAGAGNPNAKWLGSDAHMPESSVSYFDYASQFEVYAQAFAKGELKKAILSKVKLVNRPDGFDPAALFDQLCETHPNAFVYLVSHPECGLWMGASPELLLRKRGAHGQTVSLAGTKPTEGETRAWTAKELEEQELVSKHIRDVLRGAACEKQAEEGPSTVNAGNVAHLKTEFNFEFNSAQALPEALLSKLHPTPAVAGLPVNAASLLINATERHERGLYTGYLGEISASGDAELYVNLRCMQIGTAKIALYAGGGLTSASIPEDEWEETEHKVLTLYQHLNEPA